MPTLTFHLKLIGTDPLVTRTFKVSSESSMYVLHRIIQEVMGWKRVKPLSSTSTNLKLVSW